MEAPALLLCSILCFALLAGVGVEGSSHDHHHHHHHHHHRHHLYNFRPTKLFVFGDSYADTGNNAKSLANSWKVPYGITFPGKPAGRFSDGRVLTDYLAKFVGIKSPIPYKWRKYGGERLKYGMNFAYGGTGVFDTLVLDPNMTTQIDFLQQLIGDSFFAASDLKSSVALVTLAGNDYGAFLAANGSSQGMLAFIPKVVDQLGKNLQRIHEMGVKKVVVTGLQPLGCLPRSTIASSYKSCNATQNMAVDYHNLLLQQAVSKLNLHSKDSPFLLLDLYSSFMSVLKNKENWELENPLKPCCMGINPQYFCGNVDDKGKKMYTVCSDPKSAFFWDSVHPTQQGWTAVYSALQATLDQLY
ncbi:GDSL esterase/lipase At5g03610-like isoform X2 [Malania oleifera]|uniref:GDSL esterase/lipase At5g03610-like isoform X2 n=1 Tax=Malania oleifera TaxID=397392 RepID=UPI0025AE349D|nr:GDSL esterase/lipase At5g03610-like isoform X2 [Malania oleifera]